MIIDAIANYIAEKGIKQSFLCQKTRLSKHCISFTLRGKRKLSIAEYEKICVALDVPYDFFFERRREMHSQ